MYKYVNAFTNRSGDSLPGYFARLYDSTGTEVDIFADNSGTPISTVSGVSNAALSDDNGMFRWYVANGIYDIKFYDANDTFVTSESGVPMYDSGAVLDDLASETGGQMVGFLQSGTDAVAEELQATLRTATGATPFQFGAVGDGTTNDATALQKWLNRGGRLTVPKGYTFKTNSALNVAVAGTVIDGEGAITCGQRIGGGAIEVEADDCILKNFTISNPGLYSSQTSAPQACGVLSKADRARFENLNVLDFEMGLVTDAYGEHYDTWYIGNFIRVLGVGPGTPDDSSGYGEDRGDGITHWGGRAIVIGNTIVPHDDRDCRAGIFVEGLSSLSVDTTGADVRSVAIIIGNNVGIADSTQGGGGRFRRCIDAEDYDRVAIASNNVRGASWYGIEVAGNSSNPTRLLTVTGNNVLMDCPASNANGASYSVVRAGIKLYASGYVINGLNISGNNIVAEAAWGHGIHLQGGTSTVIRGSLIANNTVLALTDMGTGYHAITCVNLQSASSTAIIGNMIEGDWHKGVLSDTSGKVSVKGNLISAVDDFAVSIYTSSQAEVSDNTFRATAYGVEPITSTISLLNNYFDNVGGLHVSNSGTSALVAVGNVATGVAGAVSDFGTLTVSTWRGNVGWSYLTATSTYDPASVAANTIGGASSGITVTGAKAGDRVNATWSAVTQGLVPMAAVSATNTVISSFANPTGSAVDLGSGTMTVSVERG